MIYAHDAVLLLIPYRIRVDNAGYFELTPGHVGMKNYYYQVQSSTWASAVISPPGSLFMYAGDVRPGRTRT